MIRKGRYRNIRLFICSVFAPTKTVAPQLELNADAVSAGGDDVSVVGSGPMAVSAFDLIRSYERTAAVFGNVLFQGSQGLFASAPGLIDDNRIANISGVGRQCLDHSGELGRTLAIRIDQADSFCTLFLEQRPSPLSHRW